MIRAHSLGIAFATAFGTAVSTSVVEAQTPTWTENIAPLLQDKCMNCHRPGEVARMSLLTH